jgi:hypothetical protein
MPMVGNKKFGYDKKSMKKAKSYAEKEGKEMKMSKKDYMKYEGKEYDKMKMMKKKGKK